MQSTEQSGPSWQISPDVIFQRIGDQGLLAHMNTNRVFELNRTATRLWELLAEGLDQAQIQQQMSEDFEVNETQLTEEIKTLFDSLLAENFVIRTARG